LVALGIIEALEAEKGIDVLELEHNSTAYLHILIEAMRLAFADSKRIDFQIRRVRTDR
jgi:gamma-glutamyltranspeptidase/glutathione hydrolase